MKMTKTITITSEFHRLSTTLRVRPDGTISARAMKAAEERVCPSRRGGCCCPITQVGGGGPTGSGIGGITPGLQLCGPDITGAWTTQEWTAADAAAEKAAWERECERGRAQGEAEISRIMSEEEALGILRGMMAPSGSDAAYYAGEDLE
jgi:hypothetical protein